MDKVVGALPEKLHYQVSEGYLLLSTFLSFFFSGTNFSVGQRQLFCIARAFLKKSKILLLDEATASIDLSTDQTLQKIIQQVFKDRTVFIIAHRIATILECSKIMLLNDGKLVEFDSPQKLLSDTSSQFYALASSATNLKNKEL